MTAYEKFKRESYSHPALTLAFPLQRPLLSFVLLLERGKNGSAQGTPGKKKTEERPPFPLPIIHRAPSHSQYSISHREPLREEKAFKNRQHVIHPVISEQWRENKRTGINLASYADVLRLVTFLPTWGGTRDKPKNVCAASITESSRGVNTKRYMHSPHKQNSPYRVRGVS